MKAIFTTSANPFHYGHLDCYLKACAIFGKENVTVVIAINPEKTQDTAKIRFHMKPYRIPYVIIEGTIAKYCEEYSIDYIVRGVRNAKDCEYELELTYLNKLLNPEIETLFITPVEQYSKLSSSHIRELLKYKEYGVVSKFMDIDAMHRWINYENKISVFFGKSCVGKSTYLKKYYSDIIDVDTWMWTVLESLGVNITRLKEQSKAVVYSEATKEEKSMMLYDLGCIHLTPHFWKRLFTSGKSYVYDFASIGFYWDMIPIEIRSKLYLTEISCTEEQRQENIKQKGFSDKIKYLDELYIKPPYIDYFLVND